MANENDGRRNLVRILRHDLGLHASSVESGDTAPGIPDVEYCGRAVGQGWLEVKRIPTWPKRPGTPVRLAKGYLKRAQVSFMKQRLCAGGTSGLALQINGKDWFLISAEHVVADYDRSEQKLGFDQAWLRDHALRLSGSRGLNAQQITHALNELRKGAVPTPDRP